MMKIEENLAKADLSPFKDLKEKRMAKGIVQYQNFQTRVALEKIDFVGYSYLTAQNLFEQGIRYVKRGVYAKSCGLGSLTEYIDEYKLKLVPLTPKENERRRVTKRCNEDKPVTPKAKTVSNPITSVVATEKFEYGIEMNGSFHKFNSLDERKGFLRALKYVNNEEDLKLCHLTISYEDQSIE